MEILDAGNAYDGGRPPASIRYGDKEVVNFRREQPAQTVLGAEQKLWFLDRLKQSKATWKIWGNTVATLDMRADPQNLPPGLTSPWPGAGYAGFGGGDFSSAYVERGEIYDFVRDHGITGFATVAGDRHSFWAGLAAKSLPPQRFEPVGSRSLSVPSRRQVLSRRTNTGFRRIIPCVLCTSGKVLLTSFPSRPSIFCFAMAFDHASNTRKAETSRRRELCPIPTCLRTFRLPIWAATGTRSFALQSTRWKLNSCASLGHSSVASGPMEDLFCIAPDTRPDCGAKANHRRSGSRFSRATRAFLSEAIRRNHLPLR